MNQQVDSVTINTIEELTLISLDRTLEGLEMLRRDCVHCGERISERKQEGLAQLGQLVTTLRDFFVFESDIHSLFQMDTSKIWDAKGTLQGVEAGFEQSLNLITQYLLSEDMVSLAKLLREDLPALLDRFQDLVPVLRNYIDNEYVQTPV